MVVYSIIVTLSTNITAINFAILANNTSLLKYNNIIISSLFRWVEIDNCVIFFHNR